MFELKMMALVTTVRKKEERIENILQHEAKAYFGEVKAF